MKLYAAGIKAIAQDWSKAFVRLMNNLGGDILRKSTPLSKDNLIKMNIPQGEDTLLNLFFKKQVKTKQ